MKLLAFTIDDWIDRYCFLSRWRGYEAEIRTQLERCILRYRYSGSFLRYLFRTLEYAGRGIRPLVAYSRDWLGFARIPPATITAISREQQFSEKIHAYTLPRMQNPNSRVRDLVDMVLLVGSNQLIPEKTREAILGTFNRRGKHLVPHFLQDPPTAWEKPFIALAAECDLQIGIVEAFRTVDVFYRSLRMRS